MRYVLALLFLMIGQHAYAQTPEASPIVKASLISEQNAITPGVPLRVAVLLQPTPDWHTYWKNPGDAGIPTTLEWTLPAGLSASDIDWPTPHRYQEGPLVVYGYGGDVLLPVTITPHAELEQEEYTLNVRASWLTCKDICIPESADLSLTLPVGDATATESQPLFAAHDEKAPMAEDSEHAYSYTATDSTITLELPSFYMSFAGGTASSEVYFIPETENIIRYSGKHAFTLEGQELRITMERSGADLQDAISGIVVIEQDGHSTAYTSRFQLKAVAVQPAAQQKPVKEDMFFPLVLLFALLGGLILNLMPCVLPVLSLKALSLVKKSGSDARSARKQGYAYTLGVMVAFGAVAGLLIGLQHGGEAVGWGYQMQSPAFVGFLVYLLFLVGLSLSGVFDMPVLFGNTGSTGSFITGVLAAAVATPCTAPFMATALGVAVTLPEWQALLVFEALALGLALPFLLISHFPRMLKLLPKPGAWMETFKQFLALPMYASVVWLLWVLIQQTGPMGLLIVGSGMVAFVTLIWFKRLFELGSPAYVLLALASACGIAILSLPAVNKLEGAASSVHMDSIEYSKEKLAELRESGTPVFLDATAAWCITCQVNKQVAINTQQTMDAFKEHGVVLMTADWTLRDDHITELLGEFGFQGVPMNVYYPPHGEPVVLPQILTQDIVINTIKGDSK